MTRKSRIAEVVASEEAPKENVIDAVFRDFQGDPPPDEEESGTWKRSYPTTKYALPSTPDPTGDRDLELGEILRNMWLASDGWDITQKGELLEAEIWWWRDS